MRITTPYGSSRAGRQVVSRFRNALGLRSEWQEPTWPLPNMKDVSEADFWGWRSTFAFQAEASQEETGHGSYPGKAILFYGGHSALLNGGFAVLIAYRHPERPPPRYFEWRACLHEVVP